MRNDDVALVHRALTGDETAFSMLVEKYQKQVHAIAWRTTQDFHVAEDIVQETFLKAHQRLDTLKDPDRFSGWINAIATRCCLAWFREKRLNSELAENINIAMRHDDPYSGYLAREQAKDASQELHEIIKKWLAKLRESDRIVVTLHYFDGMSCEDIAAFLDVTTNTIKSRLNRARQRLAKIWDNRCDFRPLHLNILMAWTVYLKQIFQFVKQLAGPASDLGRICGPDSEHNGSSGERFPAGSLQKRSFSVKGSKTG